MPNPAERLLKILVEGKNFDNKKKCRDVWGSLLKVSPANDALLMARLGKTMELPLEVEATIEEHVPGEKETQAYWIKRVSAAFKQQNLEQPWETFNKYIDEHTISYLRMASKLLGVLSNGASLTDEKIDEIRESISDLLSDVRGSDIAPEAKGFLVRSLQRILLALDEYHISGSMPILTAVESTFGHVVINPEFRQAVTESSLSDKIWNTLSVVASAVTVMSGVPQIAADISNVIQALPKP
jgi:hypothetical protein